MSGSGTGQSEESYLRRWVTAIGDTTIPLLAGFSVTSVIVVSDDATNFRWPGPAIFFLGLASVVLIASVQCAYHARLHLPPQAGASQPAAEATLEKHWARSMRITYYIGIVALLAGLGLALVPLNGTGIESTLRWFASYIAFGGCLAEVGFILASLKHRRTQWS